jgi:muconolactone delta-isomerase
MAISVQDIITQTESALDAEGFERYQFVQDYMPAINYAKDWMVSAFNRVFAENKRSEEILRELVRARVFVTSEYSRVAINPTDTDDELWSVLAVYPKIQYMGSIINPTTTGQSTYCPNASYLRSYKSAKRLTLEQININRRNPFVSGNEVEICDETMEYAYTAFSDYNNGYETTPAWELEIFPSVEREPVAIVYLAYPQPVTAITDTLPFPVSLTNLVVTQVLDWISYKQGDNTNLKGVTDQDLNLLMKLMG